MIESQYFNVTGVSEWSKWLDEEGCASRNGTRKAAREAGNERESLVRDDGRKEISRLRANRATDRK